MSIVRRILVFLLLGCVTMLYAEVLSGSSLLWFINPYSILITMPFYALHTLFFLNIALRYRKTDLASLYFLGVMYSQLEAWFTTVILYGYINKSPVLGSFLGIAVWEYFSLTYFWHPIMSFILSASTIMILLWGMDSNELAQIETVNSKIVWMFLLLLGSIILTLYSKFNILIAEITYLGTIIIIIALTLICKRMKVSLSDIKLDKNSIRSLALLISILYLLAFIKHSNFQIIDYRSLIIVFLTYAFASLMLKINKPKTRQEDKNLTYKSLYVLYGITALILIMESAALPVFYEIAIWSLLSLMFLGLITLTYFTIIVAKE